MSPLVFTVRCLALPFKLSTTTTASKSPGNIRPPLSGSPDGNLGVQQQKKRNTGSKKRTEGYFEIGKDPF
jgi:hypothetical protein